MRPPLSLIFSKLKTSRDLSCSSEVLPSRDPSSKYFGCSLSVLHPSYILVPQPAPSAGGEATQHRAEQDNPSPRLVAALGLMHSRVWLALLASRAHCWLMFNLLSTRTPRLHFPWGCSPCNLQCCTLRLPCPKCRIQHLPLLNFMWLLITQTSNHRITKDH